MHANFGKEIKIVNGVQNTDKKKYSVLMISFLCGRLESRAKHKEAPDIRAEIIIIYR